MQMQITAPNSINQHC